MGPPSPEPTNPPPPAMAEGDCQAMQVQHNTQHSKRREASKREPEELSNPQSVRLLWWGREGSQKRKALGELRNNSHAGKLSSYGARADPGWSSLSTRVRTDWALDFVDVERIRADSVRGPWNVSAPIENSGDRQRRLRKRRNAQFSRRIRQQCMKNEHKEYKKQKRRMGQQGSPTRISRRLDLAVTAWFGARLLVTVIGCRSRAQVQYYNQMKDNKTAFLCNSWVYSSITIVL